MVLGTVAGPSPGEEKKASLHGRVALFGTIQDHHYTLHTHIL
jgi:hypothetical protein